MKDSNDNKPVWRRVIIMSLLPLTIFIWMTGWTLYWIGDQRMSSRTAQKETMNSFKKEIVKEIDTSVTILANCVRRLLEHKNKSREKC